MGGHDLEMLTIKEILTQEKIRFIDKDLQWGAKLSNYQEELEQFSNYSIYGIELEEDISPPQNYYRIDHHNDFSDREASIVQVLKLLGKEPTREQELIAHNDEGHIKAMECFGATKEEIIDIRKRDRATQGVTVQDEAKALEEIKNIKEEDGLYILKTTLDKFSPIVDNFEKRPFLLYSDKSLTYYGDIEFLKKQYKEQVEKKEAYHGRGYFGFDSKYVGSISSNKLVKKILEMKREKELHSYHTFMFPFIYDTKNIKESWEYKEFKTDTVEAYNEKYYFYKHVQDALYNSKGREDKSFISKYFEYKDKKGTFSISTCAKGDYELELDGISLRVFNTGVAIKLPLKLPLKFKTNFFPNLFL